MTMMDPKVRRSQPSGMTRQRPRPLGVEAEAEAAADEAAAADGALKLELELKAAGLLDRRPGLGLVAAEGDSTDDTAQEETYEAVEPDAAIPLDG